MTNTSFLEDAMLFFTEIKLIVLTKQLFHAYSTIKGATHPLTNKM